MTGTEVAVASSDELHARMEYAKALAASNLLPKDYQRQPQNVLVAMEYGQALGLAPMVAIQMISVIQGKPTMSAQLMAALVRKAGHRLRIIKSEAGVEAQVVRSDDPEFTFRAAWTMERAKAAGLTGKGGSWSTYPMAMLTARAITEVCREACPEVLAGVAYTPEELESVPPSSATAAHLVPPSVDLDTGEITDAEVVDDGDSDGEQVLR